MKRAVLAILAVMAWASVAGAVSDVHDGQLFRGVMQGRAVTMIVRADSTGDLLTSDGSHRLLVLEGVPMNTVETYYPDFFGGSAADTFSMAGRTVDSTAVLTVLGYKRLSHVLKMEGHHGAAGNAVAIAVTCLASFGSSTNDTAMTFPLQVATHANRFVADSLLIGSTSADATANLPFHRIENVNYFYTHSAVSASGNTTRARVMEFLIPAGVRTVRFIYRLISDEATAPTQGGKFKLRASVGLSAL